MPVGREEAWILTIGLVRFFRITGNITETKDELKIQDYICMAVSTLCVHYFEGYKCTIATSNTDKGKEWE